LPVWDNRGEELAIYLPILGIGLGAAIIAWILLVAALTFAVTANVSALRRSAITAPIASAVVSPCVLLVIAPVLATRVFIVQGSPSSWALYVLFALTVIGVSVALARCATLICRAIFEYLPEWLEMQLGLRRYLLVQTALLAGGGLSLLVLLVIFGWLAFILRSNSLWAVSLGIFGLAACCACLRAIFALRNPEPFHPMPLPDSIKRLIFRSARPEQPAA
jgi:hypothetical protein